jgi:hypothetical protein
VTLQNELSVPGKALNHFSQSWTKWLPEETWGLSAYECQRSLGIEDGCGGVVRHLAHAE